MQALLPEDPLKNPKETTWAGRLEPWVSGEAIAAYTGSGSSLQAALDTYKRNVFLAVSPYPCEPITS